MGKRLYWLKEDNHTLIEVKREVCRSLRRAVDRRQESQRQTARFIGTSQANLSRAIRYPTAEQMSLNQLFSYLAQLEPYFEILISI